MTTEIIKSDDNIVIACSGRIDSATADQLDSAIKEALAESPEELSLDMKDTDFISSKGIRVLVSAYKARGGKPIRILNAGSAVREIIRMAGLSAIFPMD